MATAPKARRATAAKKLDTVTTQAEKRRRADARRAEALLSLIARRKQRITEDFYDIGEALRELFRKKLYVCLAYASFNEMLAARGVMSPSQAKKLIRLVEGIPREEALALGQEKAYELVAYTAATPEPDTAAGMLRDGARVHGKAIEETSTRELQDAASEVRKQRVAASPQARERRRSELSLIKKVRALLRSAGVARAEVTVEPKAVVIRIARATAERLADC